MVRSDSSCHLGPMDLSAQLPPAESSIPPEAAAEPAPLRRSTTRRMVAGVAGGIADRFAIDVNIVRVAFVVATCLWGLGAAIYLAIWALVPTADAGASFGQEAGGETVQLDSNRTSILTVLLLLGALSIGLIFSTPWWGGPRWGGGIGVAWLLILLGLLLAAVLRPVRKFSVRRLLGISLLAVTSLVIVSTGAFFGAVALTGVPMRGGIGERVFQPTSVSQLNSPYRVAIGNTTVDLQHVPFGSGVYHVTASVAVGELRVEVPANVVVDVTAHSGIGDVVYENQSGSQQFFEGLTGSNSSHGTSASPELVLTAEAGIGQVQLYRAEPVSS
jgi:phage shock protein PspC (stress-responsive transcriptional regulator)